MVKNLRPKQAAAALGIGLSTFWLKSKTDPDFPPVIRLSERCSVVTEESLSEYVQKKTQQSLRPKTGEAVAA
jgi:predicted DNA-binding transcriptional regulator AlpA